MSETAETSAAKKPSFLDKVDPKRLRIGLIIFVVALLIRLAGMTWGLPNEKRFHSLHPDEEVVLAYSQAVEPAKLKFTPGFYNYGTLYLTMVRVTTDIVGGYGGGAQKEDGSDQYQARANFILAGRWLSVLAGAGMAWVIFALLVRRTHPLGAILGGASIGIAPALVTHSRFMTVDVVATFFLTASFIGRRG
ncbi:MAG: phospholipid carrier-dependent glycosyltransferase [Fimbriimonadaceae bacterium]